MKEEDRQEDRREATRDAIEASFLICFFNRRARTWGTEYREYDKRTMFGARLTISRRAFFSKESLAASQSVTPIDQLSWKRKRRGKCADEKEAQVRYTREWIRTDLLHGGRRPEIHLSQFRGFRLKRTRIDARFVNGG